MTEVATLIERHKSKIRDLQRRLKLEEVDAQDTSETYDDLWLLRYVLTFDTLEEAEVSVAYFH